MRDDIAQIRYFNRVFTRRLGALDSSFLGGGLSLGQARLLFEIGAGVHEVRRLRAELGLDSGYMTRMLRGLEVKGLIQKSVASADARARDVTITTAGHAKLAELEDKSDQGARSWLAPLSESGQRRLRAAMTEVLHLLQASEVTITQADPQSVESRWCLEQFFAELGLLFEGGFDATQTIPASPAELTPPNGSFFLARCQDLPVGCAALKLDPDHRGAEIKRMWVSQQVRGLGVGRRLLKAAEDLALGAGVEVLRLSTNRALTQAQTLYRHSGYQEIPLFDNEPYAHLAFEKRLR